MTKPKTAAIKIGPLRVAPYVRNGSRTDSWIVNIPPNLAPGGKRTRKFFDTKAVALAEAKRLHHEIQVEGAIKGYAPTAPTITFEELSKQWLVIEKKRVAIGKKRQVSLDTDAGRLVHLLDHFCDADIQNITYEEILTYQAAEKKRGSAPSSINSQTRLLRTILKWAADKGLLARVPKAELLARQRKRIELPTTEEVQTILSHLRPATALLVRFLAETGCRKSEAYHLEWADLVSEPPCVVIRDKSSWLAKNASSNRVIPISDSLIMALQTAKARAEKKATEEGVPASKLVFTGRGGGRVWDFRKSLATAVEKAGVTRDDVLLHITPHRLRKWFVTQNKIRGLDNTIIQPIVGHSPGSTVTDDYYTHLPSDVTRRAIIDLSVVTSAPSTSASEATLRAPKVAANGSKTV